MLAAKKVKLKNKQGEVGFLDQVRILVFIFFFFALLNCILVSPTLGVETK